MSTQNGEIHQHLHCILIDVIYTINDNCSPLIQAQDEQRERMQATIDAQKAAHDNAYQEQVLIGARKMKKTSLHS